MYTILLFTRGTPFALAIAFILVIVSGLVFWITKGFSFGYTNSKLSKSAASNILIVHLITSLVLALALPNNYLVSFPSIKKLYDENVIWIPITMFFLLVFFTIIFGFFLSLIFRPKSESIANPFTTKDDKKEVESFQKYRISALLIVAFGAFIYWMISGFKGSFNDHMSHYNDNDKKYTRNFFIGIIIIFLILTTVIKVLT